MLEKSQNQLFLKVKKKIFVQKGRSGNSAKCYEKLDDDTFCSSCANPRARFFVKIFKTCHELLGFIKFSKWTL